MEGAARQLSKRDRALAELVRVRGWADDASIDRAIAEASRSAGEPDLGSVLVASGAISPEQLQALADAIDGRSSRPRPPTRAPSGSADRTVARSDAGATVVPASGVRKPPDLIGPYRVLRELGRGGMGVVYRALDPELRREVALKVMIAGAQAHEADVERFRREAAVVAKMGRHPHLVQIHDIGRDGDRLYFTMDFVEGRSAKQRVEEEGPFPPRDAARIAAEVAGALAFAHKAGVVHRDVKPHNILLDREGKAFLGDFGLAKDLSNSMGLTESGSAFGTPAYMPPEQAGGHASQATALSDVYSLGATLFEMLTGRAPFVGETGMEIVRQVLEADPPSPSTLRDGIHRDLEVICLKALRKEPDRRFASAADMEADLRRFLTGEPIHARPPGSLERMGIWLKRHRAVVSVAAAGALLAAGIAGVAAWRMAEREREAREQREDQERREKEATPLLLEGKSLVDRADDAGKTGGWKDRAEYAHRAVETLEKARVILPRSAEVRFELGRALRRAGREEEALRVLEASLELNPKDPRAWFEHGSICQERLSRSRGTLVRLAFDAASNEVGFAVSGFSGSLVGWVGGTGAPADEEALRRTAAADFRRVVETGAVPFCAAYGEAMLAFYDGRHEEALAKVDAALRINPYFVEAIEARAEILETWKQDVAAALKERKALCEQQPSNARYLMEYAVSLRGAGQGAEALALARKAAAKVQGNPQLAARAARVVLQCGDASLALQVARETLAEGGDDGREAAGLVVSALIAMSREAEAAAELEKLGDRVDPDWAAVYRGEIARAAGNIPAALASFRRVRPGSEADGASIALSAHLEHNAGNLDRAEVLAKRAAESGISRAYRMLQGLVALERGAFSEALEDFEAVRRDFPALNANLSNLAAAKFLLRDYAGAIDALEEGVLATPLTKASREQARKSFEALRKELDGVREPADAARVVEKIFGALTLATMQTQHKATLAAMREGMRGLLRVLERFYSDLSMWPQAAGAAERALAMTRNGAVLVRLAEAKARAGDVEGAFAALRGAAEAGFDDGRRLEADPAFESLKSAPEWRDLRGRCRTD
ncbi:MAG: protein kinase [Planctomycetia bacterium]|nr:protein kinase [Planctomycetia bacterium]